MTVLFTKGFPRSRRVSVARHRNHFSRRPGHPQGRPQRAVAAGLRGADEVLPGQHPKDLSKRRKRQTPDGRRMRCQTEKVEQSKIFF